MKMYCEESLRWLLRFAGKNSGPWDDCNCESCQNGHSIPDEDMAEIIVDLLREWRYKNETLRANP